MRKIISFIIISLLFICAKTYAYRSIEFNGVERRDVIREDTLREEAKFGDYTIKIYRDWDIGTLGVLQIFKGNEIIFEEQNHKYSLGASDGDLKLDNSPEIGQDITGDGEPDLVVSHWSGGAHCCFDVYIFSIGDKFRFIDKIEGEHGFLGFQDLNGDGILEFIGYDWAFAYWNTSFAGSPAPQIVLAYKDGKYKLAYDLMKKPTIADDQYEKAVKEDEDFIKRICEDTKMGHAWTKDEHCITSEFWGHMLELIYTGHPDESWVFMDRVWDADAETKQAFTDDFKRQLALSDYADALPVDLEKFRPDIEDESEKAGLRFDVYYEKVRNALSNIKEIAP